MERLEVLPSRLRALVESMDSAAAGIEAELIDLGEHLDGLRLQWQGDAHSAFDYAQTLARHDLDANAAKLKEIAALVLNRAEVYGDVDREAARALGGQ